MLIFIVGFIAGIVCASTGWYYAYHKLNNEWTDECLRINDEWFDFCNRIRRSEE